jgi:hypothetical protein
MYVIGGLLIVSDSSFLITSEIHVPGSMLRNCGSLSYPRSSSFLCGPKLIIHICMTPPLFAILNHINLLHTSSSDTNFNTLSFYTHDVFCGRINRYVILKKSIIGFVISRVCFVASVLFNILMN